MKKLAYPVTLKTYDNGQVGASFKDVPEANTCANSLHEAMEHAKDALIVALSGYQDQHRPIPKPSRAARHPLVSLPMRVALKLAIYSAMLERDLTQQQLADLLKCDPRQVRRLLDLDHESKLSQLEAALDLFGLQAEVEIIKRPAANS